MLKEISAKQYVKVAGKLGGEQIRRDKRGTSWLSVDGTFVAEILTPKGWKYFMAVCK